MRGTTGTTAITTAMDDHVTTGPMRTAEPSPDGADGADGAARPEPGRARSLVGSFALSYLLSAVLLGALLHAGGVWNVLANTRVLDLLIRAGIVMFDDADAGFVTGVPDLEYYIASQDPIDWGLVLLCVGAFLLHLAMKAAQFHRLARFSGAEGSLGQHARAFLYGSGANRFLPFGGGNAATVAALHGQGVALEPATRAVALAELFVVLEIVVFAVVGVALVGWTAALSMLAWAAVIAVAAGLMMYGRPRRTAVVNSVRNAGRAARALAQEPRLLAGAVALSLTSFVLIDVTAYVVSQAFTSENVILNLESPVLLMAVVAGYIARSVPFTPGGIGQFELGFAAALYHGGVGLPEAVTVAVLVTLVRYVAGTTAWAVVVLGGMDTNLGRVLSMLRGAPVLREAHR